MRLFIHIFFLLLSFFVVSVPISNANTIPPATCEAIKSSDGRTGFCAAHSYSGCDGKTNYDHHGDYCDVPGIDVNCCVPVGAILSTPPATDSASCAAASGACNSSCPAYTASHGTCSPGVWCCVSTGGGSSLQDTTNFNYQLLEKIPGQSTDASLPNYVKAILNAALILIVLSAVFMAMVGGFLYLTSAGNTSRADTAKNIIVDAVIGLGLALLAYLILYVINPDLINLHISQLSASSPAAPTTSPTSAPTGPIAAGCPAGIPCTACSGCEVVTGVENKGCGGASQCYLNSALLSKIKNIKGVSGWRITESWPPTVIHMSTCHQNGTCADLNNIGGATDPKTIKTYYDAFRAAGLDVLYESTRCDSYIAAGVTNCKAYPTMTNNSSFHVK